MNHIRWMLLCLGPIPIVVASILLTQWASGGTNAARNEIVDAIEAGRWPSIQDDRSAELNEKCEQAADRLAKRLGDSCNVVVHTPFIIGGDLKEDQLQRWYARTIQPAALALSESYLQATPDEPITVLLFSNRESYNAYAAKLFQDRGISVYGYYKPTIRTLIMNIGTGGGTLVHELTHAMVDFDFGEIPDWFNEGLASLHEQCRFRESEGSHWIEGLTNWRLAQLQEAIQDDQLTSLQALIASPNFRGRQVGLNYAQARYFCMYLQQQGKLAEFYRAFRDSYEDDPTGEQTLERVLGLSSWDKLDHTFRRWVLGLRFEG